MTDDDRRTNQRKRMLRSAKIVYGDFRYTIDCVVRDRGDDGARVRCRNGGDAPDEFYLFESGQLQKASVRWRKADELGLQFLGTPINVHESQDPRLSRFRFMT